MDIKNFLEWIIVILIMSLTFSILTVGIIWGFGNPITLRLFIGIFSMFFLTFIIMAAITEGSK